MIFVSRSIVGTFLTIVCVFIVTVNTSENEKTNKKLKKLPINTSTDKTPDALLNTLEEEIKNEEEKNDGESNGEDSDLEKLEEKVESDVQKLEEKEKEEREENEGEKKEVEEEIKQIEEKVEEKLDEEEKNKLEEGEGKNEEASKTSDMEEKNESLVPDTPNSKEESDESVEFESAPENSFAVWDSKGKICLLARLNATFAIEYPSKGGEQKAKVSLTHGKSKGTCESSSKSPLLQISWDNIFTFTMIFNKSDEENWVVSSIEFTYNTSADLFDGATNGGKKTARSKGAGLFETPLGKSYFCSAQEVVLLYAANKQVVTARLKDVHLQPYGIEDGKFSQFHRCTKVIIDGLDETPFVQDETVPLAVGCTLALITLSILIGFAVHRAYNAAKVDYNNME